MVAGVMGKVPGTFFDGRAYCHLPGLVFQLNQRPILAPLAFPHLLTQRT